MPIPSNQELIGQGKGPDGELVTFFIDKEVVDNLEKYGPLWKWEDSRFVEEAIVNPDVIFEGLGRAGFESGLCYSVRPTFDSDEPENLGLPHYGMVVLVFVRQCVGGFLVYDWEWREEDFNDPGHPTNWKDFGRKLWPTA